MIAAISTSIADTMSHPDAIATPLMSSRKSSLFPILRARFRNARHIGLAPYAGLARTAKEWPNLTRCNGPSHATYISMLAPATCFPRVFLRGQLLCGACWSLRRWRDDGDVGRTLGAKGSPPPDTHAR